MAAEWVPLQLLMGLPLIPWALNEEICNRLEVLHSPHSACHCLLLTCDVSLLEMHFICVIARALDFTHPNNCASLDI